MEMREPSKTPTMREIEARHGGRDIRDIVTDSYNRLGNLRAVARELDTSHSLVWDVVDRFGGVRGVTLYFPGREGAPEAVGA